MNMPAIPRGQLCIWTDVERAHERDFNRWYDREHMQERLAIAGFQSARRFRAIGASPRPYLALYYTDSLAVFRSPAYRAAFANQTEWSLRNFARMRATQRRVGELAIELGAGEGGAMALLVVPPGQCSVTQVRQALAAVSDQDAIVRASLLCTEVGLSSPLTADAPPMPADALVMVEATDAEPALEQTRSIARELGLPELVHGFRALWRLGA